MKLTLEWEIKGEDKLTMNATGKTAVDIVWAFQKFLNNYEGHDWETIIKALKDFKP